jgi:hypothetical protein
MRTEREQDRPSEPAASKAETEKRTPATREKLAEQLDELDATERVLARYSKGARGRKTASARTPAAATKGETGKRTPATRTRSAPRAPGTQNEPEAEAAIEALKSWAGEDLPLGLVLTGPEKRKIVALVEKQAARIGVHLTDVDAILKRLDQGIAAEHAAMDRLLERIVSRTPR